MVLSLSFTIVSAAAPSCGVNVELSTDKFTPGSFIDVSVTVCDIEFGSGDGVSTFLFAVNYDPSVLTLVNTPVSDSDGDQCDYSALMNSELKGWEVMGKVYEEGIFEFSCFDISGENVAIDDGDIVVTMRFKVASNAKVNKIEISVDNIEAYNKDMSEKVSIPAKTLCSYMAPQPASIFDIPSNATPLDYAGYSNKLDSDYNFVFYSEDGCYVSGYVSKYINPVAGQDKLMGHGVIVVNSNNKVTAVDLTNSDKSMMEIPAGSYILVIDLDNTANINALENIKVGDDITLYNLIASGTGNFSEPVALTKAGFAFTEGVIDDPDPEDPNPDDPDPDDPNPDDTDPFAVVEGAPAVLSEDRKIVRVYDNSLDIAKFSAMFTGDYEVMGFDGNIFNGKFVATGMTISAGNETISIVIAGDVSGDGVVDMRDYSTVKRFCFDTAELSELQFAAAALNDHSVVDMRDYTAIKRFCFGTLQFTTFMK